MLPAKVGARCGMLSGPNGPWVGCEEGYCAADNEIDPTVRTCVAPQPAGSACDLNDQCAAPNLCVQSGAGQACLPRPAGLKPGSQCELSSSRDCGRGTYCAPPPEWEPDSLLIPTYGTCSSFRRIGQTCRAPFDVCEPLSDCVQGRCQACSAF